MNARDSKKADPEESRDKSRRREKAAAKVVAKVAAKKGDEGAGKSQRP